MVHSSIAIQVLPQFAEASKEKLLHAVDQVIAYIASTGLRYEVGAFETSVEGPWETLLEIIKRSNEICIEEGADQVYAYVRIAYSPAKELLTIDEKITKHKH